MNPELAAELESEALADTPAQEPAAEAVQAAPAQAPADEWAAMLKVGVVILTPALPFLPDIWTDEALARVGAAIVPVADKYGVSAGELFARWAPEISLFVTVAPLATATIQGFKALKAERRAEAQARAEAEAAQEPAPAAAE